MSLSSMEIKFKEEIQKKISNRQIFFEVFLHDGGCKETDSGVCGLSCLLPALGPPVALPAEESEISLVGPGITCGSYCIIVSGISSIFV